MANEVRLIDYIDKAFAERPHSQTRWIDELGNAIPADVGYAVEWWEDCLKPELLRVFGEQEDAE